jgi:phosphoribosyl-ATP pyrophosphohydrolase/phosphoribosyl-AMP cyclohydrolase
MKRLIKKIDWDKNAGLVPAIIQDASTDGILMIGYMNRESFRKTLQTKKVWFYSRSKRRLWMKGETSKNYLNLIEIKTDCDGDALLVKARPAGPTCHKGNYSCFGESKKADELSELFKIIQDRKNRLPKNSYTASLFKFGLDKILLKVVEEALEVVQAAQKQTKQRLIEEVVDLVYHLFVLLASKNIKLDEIKKEIKKRQKPSR